MVAEPGALLFKPRGQWHTAEKARPYRCDVNEVATASVMERLGLAG